MSSANLSFTVEEPLDLAVQRTALEDSLSASRTYLTACFAVFGWDFILTFPDEYNSMWKAQRWTPVRAAFFFNRYWSLLHFVISMCFLWIEFQPKTCDKVHFLQPVAAIILELRVSIRRKSVGNVEPS
ncbi:hypothetical protein BT69DRAFT_444855 [Atractiella rhizophila]|nr:hypothetical protein BT69DRAFT_444855 [Atractiella rhizophila]